MIEDSLSEVNTIATDTLGSVWHIASDFLVLIIIFLLVFLIAWRVGRGFIVSLLISLYVGYALYSIFPYSSYLPASSPLIALISSLGVFLAITAMAFLILHRAIVSDFLSIGVVGLIILSLLGAGFLLALAFHAFPIRAIYDFSPAVSALFAPSEYFFAWFVAPLLGLFFLVR